MIVYDIGYTILDDRSNQPFYSQKFETFVDTTMEHCLNESKKCAKSRCFFFSFRHKENVEWEARAIVRLIERSFLNRQWKTRAYVSFLFSSLLLFFCLILVSVNFSSSKRKRWNVATRRKVQLTRNLGKYLNRVFVCRKEVLSVSESFLENKNFQIARLFDVKFFSWWLFKLWDFIWFDVKKRFWHSKSDLNKRQLLNRSGEVKKKNVCFVIFKTNLVFNIFFFNQQKALTRKYRVWKTVLFKMNGTC